jgi:hypothetical protein
MAATIIIDGIAARDPEGVGEYPRVVTAAGVAVFAGLVGFTA